MIKLLKAPYIWIMSLVYLMIYFAIFYQYTLNSDGNVIEPLLQNAENTYSFFVILFAAILNVIFAVVLGGQIFSKEYTSNTINCLIQNSGRYKSFFAKILILFLVSCFFVLILIIMGILLPCILFGMSDGISLISLLERFLIGVISTFLISLFSMTISVILKNAAKSNIICIGLLFVTQFMPYELSKYLNFINPYYYLSTFSDSAFSNLKGLSFIKFGTLNAMSEIQNICLLLLYGTVCLTIQLIIYKKREYV